MNNCIHSTRDFELYTLSSPKLQKYNVDFIYNMTKFALIYKEARLNLII